MELLTKFWNVFVCWQNFSQVSCQSTLTDPTKWSNIRKQFVANCRETLGVFDHFVASGLKVLTCFYFYCSQNLRAQNKNHDTLSFSERITIIWMLNYIFSNLFLLLKIRIWQLCYYVLYTVMDSLVWETCDASSEAS